MQKGSLLIKGGMVVDPASNVFEQADVLVRNNKVVSITKHAALEASRTIDATGCYVFPGIIDFHAHLFHSGTEIGVFPDAAFLPQGVTTAVDQGSAGIANYESFHDGVITHSQVRIFAYLNVAPVGLCTLPRVLENVDPNLFDLDKARLLLTKYEKELLGLKLRTSQDIVGDFGFAPLEKMVAMAAQLGCPVVVHTTNPPGSAGQIAGYLRPGDVYTHMYQDKGHCLVDETGEIDQAVRKAREDGVVFDTADGRAHYSFAAIRRAMAAGFKPDVISTDLTGGNVYDKAVFGMPLIMTKYLNLGMTLPEVVAACTAAPAKVLGQEGRLGTLAPGAYADIALFRIKEMPLQLQDFKGEVLDCRQVFIPQLTVLNGKVVYASLESQL